MSCIHVPMLETSSPAKNSRALRCRSERNICEPAITLQSGAPRLSQRVHVQSSSLRAEMKTSPGTSTRPIDFIFFLPSFCFSSSLRLRVMSPP